MKISEVLHKAADEHLAYDYLSKIHSNRKGAVYKARYSCCAVIEAAGNRALCERIVVGLTEMGCPTESLEAFLDMGYEDDFDMETQGARYIWLKFAALMAEEQEAAQ